MAKSLTNVTDSSILRLDSLLTADYLITDRNIGDE